MLEILGAKINQNHGLPVNDVHATFVAIIKYVPTVAAIILGMAWKSILTDTKMMTPWSNMSEKWAKSSHSVTLDYLTSLEVISLIPAFRRRHWSVAIGLVTGFVCGALVALTNSLPYVNLSAATSQSATFAMTSRTNLNGSLQYPNGSLTMPQSYLDSEPYAAMAAQELPNGRSAAWTKDNVVFDSFRATSTLDKNSTVEAEVPSVRSAFNCHQLHYQQYNQYAKYDDSTWSSVVLKANPRDLEAANCSPMPQLSPPVHDDQVMGWLNVTSCSNEADDTRVIANIAVRKNAGTVNQSPWGMVGLLCKSEFILQSAWLQVNMTPSYEVLSYAFNSSSTTTAIGVPNSNAALYYIYLNNPNDVKSQKIFQPGTIFNDKPTADFGNATDVAYHFIRNSVADPFFATLTEGQVEIKIKMYEDDPYRFQADVELVAGRMLAQVLKSFARENNTGDISGIIRTTQPRLFLRRSILRVLDAALVFICLVCLLHLTLLRPKTILKENPGTIASTAMTLASASRSIEDFFSHEVISAESHLKHILKSRE
ncbi:MAG: hypothetical protein Q9160_006005 [Pyrenula sp. 1 TL-2023]